MKKLLLLICFALTVIVNYNSIAQVTFYVETPPNLEGQYGFSYATATSGWGYDMDTVYITGKKLVLIRDDNSTNEDSLGCLSAINGSAIMGNIAVVYRGTCEFGVKALNAQVEGAIGVIIINSVTGGTITPGAGAQGANVTIPVIMISKEDGALLRPAIDAGTATATIGNQSALLNNLVILSANVVLPSSFAIPTALTSNFPGIPIQGWVSNYGQNDQTNVTLSAKITLGTQVLYDETSSAADITSLTQVNMVLPTFTQTSYAPGLYTLTYTINYGATDDYPSDNSIVANFWVNDIYYSKSRLDTNTLMPIGTGSIGENMPGKFGSCITLDIKNANNQRIYGLSFAANASDAFTPISLIGTDAEIKVWQWDDAITPASITFTSLTDLGNAVYNYSADLQNQFVSVPFTTPIDIQDNTRYLACVYLDRDATGASPFVRLSSDTKFDYATTEVIYRDTLNEFSVFCPFDSAGATWFAGGWNSNNVPAIITHFAPVIEGLFMPARTGASFTFTATCGSNNVSFQDASDTAFAAVTWAWDFGDPATTNDTSSAQNPTYTYTVDGSYNVRLIVTNLSGFFSYFTIPVSISSNLPVASFSNTTVCVNAAADFTDNSTNFPNNWTWNFGDAGMSNAQNPSHIYTSSGTFPVELIVTNACGMDTTTTNVIVNPVPVISDFSADKTTAAAGETITFTANATGATSYTWNFGDGNTGTGSPATHDYSFDGSYTVTLYATNDSGCKSSMVKSAYITIGGTSVNELSSNPYKLSIFPNPSTNVFNINYSVPENSANVKLSIYNMLGANIADLISEKQNQGPQSFVWKPAPALASNTYFCVLDINGEKMVMSVIHTK